MPCACLGPLLISALQLTRRAHGIRLFAQTETSNSTLHETMILNGKVRKIATVTEPSTFKR